MFCFSKSNMECVCPLILCVLHPPLYSQFVFLDHSHSPASFDGDPYPTVQPVQKWYIVSCSTGPPEAYS